MKIFIFVKGASNRDKTTAITELAKTIGVDEHSDMWLPNRLEIRGVQEWKGVSVALCSQGDPGSCSVKWIKETAIDSNHCEIIIAACRCGGSTQDPILPYLREMGYTIVEVSPISISTPNFKIPDYKTLARGITQQVLFLMNNRENLTSNSDLIN